MYNIDIRLRCRWMRASDVNMGGVDTQVGASEAGRATNAIGCTGPGCTSDATGAATWLPWYTTTGSKPGTNLMTDNSPSLKRVSISHKGCVAMHGLYLRYYYATDKGICDPRNPKIDLRASSLRKMLIVSEAFNVHWHAMRKQVGTPSLCNMQSIID